MKFNLGYLTLISFSSNTEFIILKIKLTKFLQVTMTKRKLWRFDLESNDYNVFIRDDIQGAYELQL